jgi:hypothetical protein
MKKIFTLILLCSIILGVSAQTKVLYLGYGKTTMTGTGADPFLAWLQTQTSTYTVDTCISVTACTMTYATAVARKSTNGCSDYDIVVMSDCLDGKKCSTLTASVITKPCLFNKLFAMSSGRLNMGTPQNMTSGPLYIYVPTDQRSVDIFSGITIPSDGRITIFNAYTDDYASTTATASTVGIQVVQDGTYTLSPTTGMTVYGQDTSSLYHGVSLFKLAANTQMYYGSTTGQAYTVPMIGVGFNYGSMWLTGNFTDAGLQILKNSMTILASTSTDVKSSEATQLKIANEGNNVYTVYLGASQKTVASVYSLTGALVSQQSVNSNMVTIDLSGKPAGIYIIKVGGISQKVVVE